MQFPSTRALDVLDVSIPSGVTGLVGANGAGKTTLISLVLGLLSPTSGSINVLGLDPAHDGPELRAQIGYGPERNVFPDDLRAYDFVRHLAEVKGLPRDEARSRASDSLYLVGLGEERFRALGTMSTGQRQRVKLAQAIAADPRLIVLDEPTDGLDPVQRDEMLNIIVQVNRDFGIDVMLSSHVLEEVERVCDHVVALGRGQARRTGVDDRTCRFLGRNRTRARRDPRSSAVGRRRGCTARRSWCGSASRRQLVVGGGHDRRRAVRPRCAQRHGRRRTPSASRPPSPQSRRHLRRRRSGWGRGRGGP